MDRLGCGRSQNVAKDADKMPPLDTAPGQPLSFAPKPGKLNGRPNAFLPGYLGDRSGANIRLFTGIRADMDQHQGAIVDNKGQPALGLHVSMRVSGTKWK